MIDLIIEKEESLIRQLTQIWGCFEEFLWCRTIVAMAAKPMAVYKNPGIPPHNPEEASTAKDITSSLNLCDNHKLDGGIFR